MRLETGCQRTKWLHVHHIRHWEDGGPTDTANLMALCSRHHRLHHRGGLGISGNAYEPDGIVFTDARGRPLAPAGQPTTPTGPLPTGSWTHPTGERLDDRWVDFARPSERCVSPSPVTTAAPPVRSPLRDYLAFIDLDDPVYGVNEDEVA
ncbi:MAG TPA: HNH endonuclease signature motif containing protein [Acidimicrobiales bacterium]|nr:HNH endonuclease signature motif containing protein [Acidimicrobiales bacterium]